jgi:hypothetical protein
VSIVVSDTSPIRALGHLGLIDLLRELFSTAITLASEISADAILIDESDGRRVAEARGLDVVGTLGVLIAARQYGLIGPLRPLIE